VVEGAAQLDPARLEIVRTMAQHGLQSIDGVRVLVSQAVDVRLEKGDADDLLDDRVAERCLVRKVMVHRALRYARALQDRIHTRSLEPVQVNLLERRLEQASTRLLRRAGTTFLHLRSPSVSQSAGPPELHAARAPPWRSARPRSSRGSRVRVSMDRSARHRTACRPAAAPRPASRAARA